MSETEIGGTPESSEQTSFDRNYKSCIDVSSVLLKLGENYNNLAAKIEYGGLTMALASIYYDEASAGDYTSVIRKAKENESTRVAADFSEAVSVAMRDRISAEDSLKLRDFRRKLMIDNADFSEEDLDWIKKIAHQIDAICDDLLSAGWSLKQIRQ